MANETKFDLAYWETEEAIDFEDVIKFVLDNKKLIYYLIALKNLFEQKEDISNWECWLAKELFKTK